MSVYVYVLTNNINPERYVGISKDPQERLNQHNRGTSRYTKAFIPWRIIYTEEYADYSTARVREKYLKSSAGMRFITEIMKKG